MDENDDGPKSGPMPAPDLRWNDPEQVRLWLTALRDAIDDGFAAGEDATRRPRKRVLSRAEARRKLKVARRSIEAQLKSAERALDSK